MESKVLFLDLDGTLLNDRKEITPGNRQAIAQALERGRRIVITSGRPLKSALNQAESLGLAGEGCYVIAYNGGTIYDCSSRRLIHREAMAPEALYRIWDEAARRDIYIQTYDQEDVVIEPRCDEEIAQKYGKLCGMDWRVIGDVRRDLSQPPAKTLLISYRDPASLQDMARWIQAQMAGLAECFFSSPYFLEVVPAGVSKGFAVTELCRRLGIGVENAVAAGDESNDISMIQAAGIGAAMANAIPAVKEAADYITQRDNNHDGIEEIIRRFLL